MFVQYAKFFINGSIIGLAGLVTQWLIYQGLGGRTGLAYGLAVVLTYMFFLIINFFSQRRWIFHKPGLFGRFIIANIVIMIFVALLSPLLRFVIDALLGYPWGDWLGFVTAVLISSVPSFLLQRNWVFKVKAQ